jgi:hypothetical protein
MKWIILSFLMTTFSFANLHLAPPDFETRLGRAVFVDFKKADYEITYDLKHRKAVVKSRLEFQVEKEGHPLFDLIPTPRKLSLNGELVGQRELSLREAGTSVRMVEKKLTPGFYVLEMENDLNENTYFIPAFRYVASAFWIRDLKDRMFLEQYLPTNFEFDQFQMNFEVKLIGNRREHEIYSNGRVKKFSNHHYQISFPEYFTTSSLYFHLAPRGFLKRIDFSYKSISGKNIPITVYSPWWSRTRRFYKETLRVMKELENDYGPWAHPSFVAYGTLPGTGGMEHSGATATSFAALDHEMLHSYFAKGVMPANGNSGWIDEAIAAWRDRGYPRLPDPGFEGSNLGGHSPYQRFTDDGSYSLGSSFLAYLDWKLQQSGGLKAFLKGYFEAYKHQVITTEHFKSNLEFWSGIDLTVDFDQYIFGKNSFKTLSREKNPYHHLAMPSVWGRE